MCVNDMRRNDMAKLNLWHLAVFFTLVMVFSGCDPEFNDVESANFANSETPNTPKNVKATALSSDSIKISWDPVPGCTDYKVYWYDETDEKYYLAEHQIPVTWYVDDVELEPETTYYYKVAAYSNGKFFRESPMSAAVHATTLAAGANPIVENILDPPTGVTATASSPTSILVQWNTVQNATGYNLYSSYSSDGDYTYRAFIGTGVSPGWVDNDCQPGQTMYYRVATVSADGEGERSAAVHTTTEVVSNIPSTPTGVSASVEGTTITITWNYVSNATSYYVYRSDYQAGSYLSLGTAYSTSYTDIGLAGNRYIL